MYTVELLLEAKKIIKNLDLKLKAKVFKTIELLEEFGPFLHEPHAKKIQGIKYLYELRIQQGNNIGRIF